jgi:hypothetical protein
MSRSISIWYSKENKSVDIDTGHNDLLGTQQASLKFWDLPILKIIGLKRLTILGHADPVWFTGWEDLKELENEISILEENKALIPFDKELLIRWIANLRYCFNILIERSPKSAEPNFMIG